MGWADSVAASTKRSGQAQGFITIGLYEFYDGFGFYALGDLRRCAAVRRVARAGGGDIHALGPRIGGSARDSHRRVARGPGCACGATREDRRAGRGPRRVSSEGEPETRAGGSGAGDARRRRITTKSRPTIRISRRRWPSWWPAGKPGRGVIIDGAGIGSSIAANKVSGIRAALCYDRASARNSREHNDSNVLTLGARLLTGGQAEEVLRTWLETPFAGGRHTARVEKIARIEREYSRVPQPLPDGMPSGPACRAGDLLARMRRSHR
jgi:hypothetical protein